MKDNLERYLELTSLKLYTTQFFEEQTIEEYKFKSFSFYLKKEKDIIKIISRHNKRIKLKIDSPGCFSFFNILIVAPLLLLLFGFLFSVINALINP